MCLLTGKSKSILNIGNKYFLRVGGGYKIYKILIKWWNLIVSCFGENMSKVQIWNIIQTVKCSHVTNSLRMSPDPHTTFHLLTAYLTQVSSNGFIIWWIPYVLSSIGLHSLKYPPNSEMLLVAHSLNSLWYSVFALYSLCHANFLLNLTCYIRSVFCSGVNQTLLPKLVYCFNWPLVLLFQTWYPLLAIFLPNVSLPTRKTRHPPKGKKRHVVSIRRRYDISTKLIMFLNLTLLSLV